MSKVRLNVNIDQEIKDQAKALFEDIGLDMTTAINLFLRTAIREQKIPFKVSLNLQEASQKSDESPTETISIIEDEAICRAVEHLNAEEN